VFIGPLDGPLEAPSPPSYGPGVDQSDRDVEIFERIPWDSLGPAPDRRWWAYVVAAAIVMGALGVSVGRSWSDSPAPIASTAPTTAPPIQTSITTAPAETAERPRETVPVPSTTSSLWSEADLMAVPEERLLQSAAGTATRFVVDHFTRDEDGDGGGRSFVEWAEAIETTWTGADAVTVTVVVRRLAAADDDAYRRVPDEAWEVDLRLEEARWAVVGGPAGALAPDLVVDLAESEWDEWTDVVGLTWQVSRPPGT
jgi:hypothetical protein